MKIKIWRDLINNIKICECKIMYSQNDLDSSFLFEVFSNDGLSILNSQIISISIYLFQVFLFILIIQKVIICLIWNNIAFKLILVK